MLSPIDEEHVSEAAGVNSAGGSFGLSFGLAFSGAILSATLSVAFTTMAQNSTVLPPADQQQVSKALEHDAEVISNTQLEAQLQGEPRAIRTEILRINTDARHLALQSRCDPNPGQSAWTVHLIQDDALTGPPTRPVRSMAQCLDEPARQGKRLNLDMRSGSGGRGAPGCSIPSG